MCCSLSSHMVYDLLIWVAVMYVLFFLFFQTFHKKMKREDSELIINHKFNSNISAATYIFMF